MDEAPTKAGDALCNAARDVSLHIAGMISELNGLRHPHAAASPSTPLIGQQLNKIKDQLGLLGAIVSDIERHERAAAGEAA